MSISEFNRDSINIGLLGDKQPDIQKKQKFKHWSWHFDDTRIAWLLFAKKDSSANTLSSEVLQELNKVLSDIEGQSPRGLVIRSTKISGFAMGAEISDFIDMVEPNDIELKIRSGLDIFDRIANFPAVTVALIHGYCIGGGLELALACQYRIASGEAKFGFPEVKLGLHPGLAGTWRSMRLVSPTVAMDMMLTGRNISAKAAKKFGLIDVVTEERHFVNAVKSALRNLPDRKLSLFSKLADLSLVRGLISSRMEKKVADKVRQDHYPAPYELINLWREHGRESFAMRRAETESFSRLIASDISKNLVKVFFLRDKLNSYAKSGEHLIKNIHVIGSGVMGADIAAWCAVNGFNVSLQDINKNSLAEAQKRIEKIFFRKFKNTVLIKEARDRLVVDMDGYGIKKADLVIEAVTENLEIKLKVFAAAEKNMRVNAILATNTSSIILDKLLPKIKKPERFIGLHFFNPVAQMPLVEIINHDKVADKIKQRIFAFTGDISKLPLPVSSSPGFLVNRVLIPYIGEAFLCKDEGIEPELIDFIAEDFGMPMGPLELADRIGLDVCLHVSKVLLEDLPNSNLPKPTAWIENTVKAEDLGRKTGKGVYNYISGKPKKNNIDNDKKIDPKLCDRLILPLLNSCVACWREGVVGSIEEIDAGMVFGSGFAPFRGGPISYAKTRGVDNIISALEDLQKAHGDRFKPDQGWKKLK